MGLLNSAPAFLNSMLGNAGGLSVTYSRGARNISLDAADGLIWDGDAKFAVNNEGGPRIVWGERAYLIVADALGNLGEPEEGDRIIETIDGTAMTFEVAQPSSGDPAVRPSDPSRSRFRVNCRRVK